MEGSCEMTSKQRAYLKSLASTMEPIYQIGKSGVSPELTKGIDEALEARELIKINVLKTCALTTNEIAIDICANCHCELVQIIGKTLVFYKKAKEPKIDLDRI